MLLKPPRVYPTDAVTSRMESNLGNAIDAVISIELLSGIPLSSISLKALAPKKINQSLGHLPSGWFLSDIDTLTQVRRVTWDASSITLEALNDCTVSIWVW